MTFPLNKRTFALALATGALLAASGAHAQTALDDIMKSKVLKVAVQTDSAPYGFVGTDLKPMGLDVDMANLIGKKLGVPVELVVVVSASRIPALQTKKADLVIATLGKNPEREKVIDFSSAYSPFFQAVFGPKNIAVKSFADLAGKSVGCDPRRHGRPGAGQSCAPAGLDTKRFEDNNATIAAFTAGQAESHVLEHAHVAEQGVVLEHEAHVALAHVHVGGVFAAEVDAAGVGRFQAGNDAQQRGLAAARGAEQREQFARSDVEVDVAQGLERAEVLVDVADFNAHGVLSGAVQWGALAVAVCKGGVGRSGGSSARALSSLSMRHSATDLMASVTSASRASSEATANAATDWYSL